MKSDHLFNRRHTVLREKNFTGSFNQHATFVQPLAVLFSGASEWRRGHFFSRESCDVFALEFVVSGNIEFTQDSRSYIVEKNEMFFLRKGSRHIYKTGTKGFCHKRFISIDGPMLDPLLRLTGLWGIDHIVVANPMRVMGLFRSIYGICKEKKEQFPDQLSAQAYLLLLELGKSIQPQYPESIRKGIEFMHKNLNTNLTSEQICTHVGLSQTHFNRLFRKYMHCAPVAFFISQRMAWAQHLLSSTLLSVKEIAVTVGYENPLYFSSQFKKETGLSPKMFRTKTPG